MSISWLLFVFVLVLIAQNAVYMRWGLKKLTYQRTFSRSAVFEGDEVEMVEVIANRKLLPLPWLRLESSISIALEFSHQANLNISGVLSGAQATQNHRSVFSLKPYTHIKRRHRVRCLKRGNYTLNTATMTCGDIWGYKTLVKTEKFNAELLVYPRLVPIESIPFPSHSWLGEVIVRRWIIEDPFMIAGVRDYSGGEPMNKINWKLTARTGKLQVAKNDFTADHHLMIYLNFEVTEQMWGAVTDPELIEQGIRYAASISQMALDKGIKTGFVCNSYFAGLPKQSVRCPAQSGSEQLAYILGTMAKLEMGISKDFSTLLEEDIDNRVSNTDFLMITSFVSDKLRQTFSKLQELGNAVEIVPLQKERSKGGEQHTG